MTSEEEFRESFASLEVSGDFTFAELTMRDGSRLSFCHRVGERWVRAVGTGEAPGGGLAAGVLPLIATFRLNARHLDVRFHDGGRWEAPFGG